MKTEDLIPDVYETIPGAKCSVCEQRDKALAHRIIEYARSNPPAPIAHIPIMATSSGHFPICRDCAPPCRKCGLPIQNGKIKRYFKHICRVWWVDHPGAAIPIQWGSGICQHTHIFGITI